MSTPVTLGTNLSGAVFGALAPESPWANGIAQTSEQEFSTQVERVRGADGSFIGGAKYGPERTVNITYISTVTDASNTDMGDVFSADQITIGTSTFYVENIRKASTNTGFVTFTMTGFGSDDIAT